MISLLCPTRGRPGAFGAMIRSAAVTAAHPEDIEVVAYVDEDDPALGGYATAWQAGDYDINLLAQVIGPRCVLSDAWNRAGDWANGDIWMMAADDLRFVSLGWDDMVTDAFAQHPDGIALVYGRDGHADERMATHPFVTRRWVDIVGRFTAPYFAADYCDLWLHEVAKRINRATYTPQLLISHLHPSFGLGEWDGTHRERMERAREVDLPAMWKSTEGERVDEAVRLLTAMRKAAE